MALASYTENSCLLFVIQHIFGPALPSGCVAEIRATTVIFIFDDKCFFRKLYILEVNTAVAVD